MPKTYIAIAGQTYDAKTITPPNDRTFRNAWVFDGAVIDVDMAVARDIHRDHIRIERLPRFDPFDTISIPLSRKAAGGAVLTTDEKNAINTAEFQAQKLRDAPADPRIDTATTPDELKALTLDVLTT